MTWVTVFTTVIAGVGGVGGLVALLNIGATRRRIVAQADETVASTVRVLGGAAADLVEPLRRALDVAEGRADRVNVQLGVVQRRVDALDGQLRRLVTAILSPTATIDGLRELVAHWGGSGGDG